MRQRVTVDDLSADIIDRIGSVVDVQVWSETHVRGGGGGHIREGSGYISSWTRSSVENKFRVFVHWNDQTEEAIVFGESFPLRTGHALAERRVVLNGQSRRVMLCNMQTGQIWRADSLADLPKLSIRRYFWRGFLIALLIFGSLGAFLFFSYVFSTNPPSSRVFEAFWQIGGIALGISLAIGLITYGLVKVTKGPRLAREKRKIEQFRDNLTAAVFGSR